MSELEKAELISRIEGMTAEEKVVTVQHLPSDLLWDELHRRDSDNRKIINGVRMLLMKDAEC